MRLLQDSEQLANDCARESDSNGMKERLKTHCLSMSSGFQVALECNKIVRFDAGAEDKHQACAVSHTETNEVKVGQVGELRS